MAVVEGSLSFGLELKDAFKSVNSWVANGIGWLDDIQQFYRERSAIEKEYSSKLNALAKKFHEKKAKKSSSLSVGDTPAMTPGSLESTSLRTWTAQLNTVESQAAEHERYGAELVIQLVDPLKAIAVKFEDLRKRHTEHASKLEAERDSSYNDLKKIKNKYDNCCQEVENKRKKTESSFDFSKTKAQNSYQQQVLEMHNLKNSYLIAISVTNAQKEKYYHEYIPELLDSLQDLSQSRTAKLNDIWSLATQIETNTLKRNIQLLDHLATEIKQNEPLLDSMMFVEHNVSPWHEPPDKTFIPSPIWHDDGEMMVDETAVVFLRNVLAKSKAQLGDLRRDVDKKRRDIESAKRVKQQIREGKDNRDEVEIVKSIFAQQEELHIVDHKRLAADVETNIITAVVGDVTLGAKSHNIKSQTFKIPTNCDLCGERIWGISGKGFECRDCGYTCHSKCEMKVPAECPGELNKEQKKKLKSERQETANSLVSTTAPMSSTDASLGRPKSSSNPKCLSNSGYIASARQSICNVKAPLEETPDVTGSTFCSGAGQKNTPWKNRIVAPPPSTYISETQGNGLSSKNTPGKNIGGEQKAKMIYDYVASGEGEVSVGEGKELVILESDDGGWTKVRTPSKECGVVPTSYLEILVPSPASILSNSSSLIGSQKKPGPPVAPKRGAKKLKLFEALYDYNAQNEAELSITVGERFVLIQDDPGDGWAEIEKGGQVGNVPASYIQAIS